MPKRLRFSGVRNDDAIEMKLERVAELQKEEEAIAIRIQRSDEEIEGKRHEQMNVQVEIEHWARKSKEAEKLLRKYTSSYQLKKRIKELDDTLRRNRQIRDELKEQHKQYEEELTMLQQGRFESPRQKQAIHHLKQQQIAAYPLSHFVKLIDDESIHKEALFNGIKYTVFYEGMTCQPINDLYHVSLQKTIPTRLITSLPQHGITMRKGLSPTEQNNAARVLWWIEQFFVNQSSYIKQGVMVDPHGKRGPQEQGTFILSQRALTIRETKVTAQLNKIAQKIEQFIERIHGQSERYSAWSADIHKVEEAEALLSQRVNQQYRITQIEEITNHLACLQNVKRDFEIEGREIWKQLYELQREIDGHEAIFEKRKM